MERLRDLERIQKFNEEKLKKELEKLELSKYRNNSKSLAPRNSKELQNQKQQKKIQDYQEKIRMYEKNFLKEKI